VLRKWEEEEEMEEVNGDRASVLEVIYAVF